MHRANIGELEELVLLLVAMLNGSAYGVLVKNELKSQANRSINISAIHAALRRLEAKGLVKSDWSEATAERGGRRKRLFTITAAGDEVLRNVMDVRVKIWNQIPGYLPKFA
ncbi:MAG: helix-turn-helix transcriptional regulator [Bacteroidota bacterium]